MYMMYGLFSVMYVICYLFSVRSVRKKYALLSLCDQWERQGVVHLDSGSVCDIGLFGWYQSVKENIEYIAEYIHAYMVMS